MAWIELQCQKMRLGELELRLMPRKLIKSGNLLIVEKMENVLQVLKHELLEYFKWPLRKG